MDITEVKNAVLSQMGLVEDEFYKKMNQGKRILLEIKKNKKATQIKKDQNFDALKSLDALRTYIGDCQRCGLCKERTNIVFGSGDIKAKLMFVGEGPGREEDLQGLPFVGRAGKLLTKIIEAIDLTRDEVYIGNIVKCRPPNNRNPKPEEILACGRFLFKQIEIIKPKVLVALGTFAAQYLLNTDTPISRIRGKFIETKIPGSDYTVKVMPTFHPAYLLRNPSQKKLVWEDIQKVQKLLAQV